jgi:hypothetical protein
MMIIRKVAGMKKVYLFHEIMTEMIFISIVESCPDVTELIMEYCTNLTDICVNRIGELYPNLTELQLSLSCEITEMSVIRLAKCCLNYLKKLNLFEYCIDKRTETSIRSKLADICPNLTVI